MITNIQLTLQDHQRDDDDVEGDGVKLAAQVVVFIHCCWLVVGNHDDDFPSSQQSQISHDVKKHQQGEDLAQCSFLVKRLYGVKHQ